MPGDPTITLHDFLFNYLSPAGLWASKGRSWKSYAPSSGTTGKYEYSNVGACLAAYICERVAQQHGLATDFNDLVRRQIYGRFVTAGSLPPSSSYGYMAADIPGLGDNSSGYAQPSQYTKNGWQSCGGGWSVCDYPTCDWRSSAVTFARLFGMFIVRVHCLLLGAG